MGDRTSLTSVLSDVYQNLALLSQNNQIRSDDASTNSFIYEEFIDNPEELAWQIEALERYEKEATQRSRGYVSDLGTGSAHDPNPVYMMSGGLGDRGASEGPQRKRMAR